MQRKLRGANDENKTEHKTGKKPQDLFLQALFTKCPVNKLERLIIHIKGLLQINKVPTVAFRLVSPSALSDGWSVRRL